MPQMLADYVSLTKPRITSLVLVTAALGYFLAGHGIKSWTVLLIMLFGTALTSSGAAVLNQYLERNVDSLMHRTKRRPIPTGRILPHQALSFGILLILAGTVLLVWRINILTGFLALMTAFLYVLVYTPLKRMTWLNTFVGAIPGAIPPLGGWAAANGELEVGAWILFLILFVWQHPHFYSIAWMYREDYARGGFKMLPVVEPDGASTFRQIIIYSCILIPVSLLPTLVGMTGRVYMYGTLVMGIGFLALGILLAYSHTVQDARRVLRASVIYLPILLALIVGDVGF